jgi:hypothetical protein
LSAYLVGTKVGHEYSMFDRAEYSLSKVVEFLAYACELVLQAPDLWEFPSFVGMEVQYFITIYDSLDEQFSRVSDAYHLTP